MWDFKDFWVGRWICREWGGYGLCGYVSLSWHPVLYCFYVLWNNGWHKNWRHANQDRGVSFSFEKTKEQKQNPKSGELHLDHCKRLMDSWALENWKRCKQEQKMSWLSWFRYQKVMTALFVTWLDLWSIIRLLTSFWKLTGFNFVFTNNSSSFCHIFVFTYCAQFLYWRYYLKQKNCVAERSCKRLMVKSAIYDTICNKTGFCEQVVDEDRLRAWITYLRWHRIWSIGCVRWAYHHCSWPSVRQSLKVTI